MHGSKFSDMGWIMLVSLLIWIRTLIIAKCVALVQNEPTSCNTPTLVTICKIESSPLFQ